MINKYTYTSKNSLETKGLEDKIKILEESSCFGVTSGPHEFIVKNENGIVVLEPGSPDTTFFVGLLYTESKYKDSFKIVNFDKQKETNNIDFEINNIVYRVKSYNK